MQEFELVVDFNGIVVFDCQGLQNFYSGIPNGANIYKRFTTTDDGDMVVLQGLVVPIMGINDSVYKIKTRMANEAPVVPEHLVIVSNAGFPLQVTGRVVIADMAVLLDWSLDEGWQDIALSAGFYSVAINGFQRVENHTVVECGFELVFAQVDELPAFTGELMKSMQVNALPVSL